MKTFPTLYKKTSTGAIQFWNIKVLDVDSLGHIVTEYGQVGTDSPQTTFDIVAEGKNTGKKNATTAVQQAEAEAKSQWTQKKKKGYVESAEGAEGGERDAIITGGIDPMLAHHYMDVIYDLRNESSKTYEKSKDAKKITFPCYGQPKLDGIRCIAMVRDGVCTLWTRTRKPILSCPHIAREIESIFGEYGPLDVDGELYNHDLKADFEKIVSAVRKDEPSPDSLALVQYHVYDLARMDLLFKSRRFMAATALNSSAHHRDGGSSPVKLVQTIVLTEEQVIPTFEAYCTLGYEGLMLRNADSKYVGKRSYDLQKLKPFQDAEFKIVGFTEGRGKLAGKLGTFICQGANDATFETPMNGEQASLERLFKEGSANIGKMLTVRYQGLTGKNKVPRFPKGHSIRDYE